MAEIVGFENPGIDFLCTLPHLPGSNEAMYMQKQSWQGGGQVSTGLVAASRLGATTALIGTVGDDIFGRFCCNDLIRHGVDISNVKVRPGGRTGFSLVLSDEETRGRSIIMRAAKTSPLQEIEVDFDMVKQAKVLHLAWVDSIGLEAARIAKENGVTVLLDADNYYPLLEEVYQYVDVLIASQFVYDHYFTDDEEEKNLKTTLSWGPKVAIYTKGSKGCVGLWKGGFFHQNAFQVPIVDTVGAGDVFHGAFASCLVRGMNPVEAAEFSSAVSAIKCTRIGGRAGLPTREMTEHFLKTGEIQSEELDKRVAYYERGLEQLADEKTETGCFTH